MRKVRVELRNDIVRPGEMLEGHVIVDCDECFRCNRLSLKITGSEKTEITLGDNRYYDSYTHIAAHIILEEAPVYYEGETSIPFTFRVPDGVPRSLRSGNARIEYKVKAVIELDWRPDPSHTQEFIVLPQTPKYVQPDPEGKPIVEENDDLIVHLPTGILRQDQGLKVRMKIERERVDRAEVCLKERVNYTCRTHDSSYMFTVLTAMRDMGIEDVGRWIDCTLGMGLKDSTPVHGKLITVDYLVEVKLGVKRALDPYVRIPIIISGPPTEELDEAVGVDFGF